MPMPATVKEWLEKFKEEDAAGRGGLRVVGDHLGRRYLPVVTLVTPWRGPEELVITFREFKEAEPAKPPPPSEEVKTP